MKNEILKELEKRSRGFLDNVKIREGKTKYQRFVEKIDIKDNWNDCWEWLGSLNNDGYGQFNLNGKSHLAHRVAYQEWNGIIPEGMQINHKCHNPACCNPWHIYAGTAQDNVNDCINAGRRANFKEELNGRSKLTKQQVLEIRSKYIPWKYSAQMLADEYNVSQTTIYHIINKKSWRYV